MTVDEFLGWAETQPGRYELVDGEVVAMAPERAGHSRAKMAAYGALAAGIKSAELPCEVLGDRMTVRLDERTAYEPDALVYCGDRLAADAIEVPNPLIVVEVTSPSTSKIDIELKLIDYFRLPSVVHYLIVDIKRRAVVHHQRGPTNIETRILRDGEVRLDPPGLSVAVADLFGEP